MRQTALWCVTLFYALTTAFAQPKVEVNWRLRVEDWQWFNVAGYDTDYTYAHSLLRVALTGATGNSRWTAELAQAGLFDVPNAVAPPPAGQLGFGGNLRAVNGDNKASLFVKQLHVEWSFSGSTLRVGRMEFADGREVALKDAGLNWLHANRLSNRLIGTFGFSPITRSFDGVLWQWGKPAGRVVFFAAYPTQGAFDLNGNPTLTNVNQLYLAYARAQETEETSLDWRLFGGWYRDTRNVLKVDNRPLAARQSDREDIRVWTLGGHWAQVWKSAAGRTDALLWGALQGGDWGQLRHSAYALAVEAGFQFPTEWKPWVRAGYYVGSGDGNNTDGTHGTFVAGMNTPRLYALTPFYNTMNLEDAFVQVMLTPHPRWTARVDYHRLRLHRSADLWYAGGGPFDNSSYGVAGRPSGGNRDLAHLFDISLSYRASNQLQISLYKSWVQGGGVIRSVYPAGEDGGLFFIEANYRW
ncbi:MAG: alginate export family protein [Armatimonadota bacterium]|nr:alginate export family protein [Armatimonadota bacterium]MDW8103449.1 alginate export family protein [Armatimonadota bacterium]